MTQLTMQLRLRNDQKMSAMRPDIHVRRRDGRLHAYICEDKYGNQVVIAQRLADIVTYIATQVTCKADAVTVTSLYQILKVKDGQGRTGGWSKNRWRCRAVEMSEATAAFERLRAEYPTAIVLGSPNCIHIGQREAH